MKSAKISISTRTVIEFIPDILRVSFGFRPKRNQKRAVRLNGALFIHQNESSVRDFGAFAHFHALREQHFVEEAFVLPQSLEAALFGDAPVRQHNNAVGAANGA